MNAAETLKMARSTGITITVTDGRMNLRGVGDRPPALLESIRVNKTESMALIQHESAKDANKAKEAGQEDLMARFVGLPLPAAMPHFTPEERQNLVDQVMRQGKPATGWCMVRANAYFEAFPHSEFLGQEAAAAADFLRWQDEATCESVVA